MFIPDEYQWVQPINQFYHWEKNNAGFGKSNKGDFFNGICMYNWHPCEYLHIKLNERLIKDSLYQISTNLRIAQFKAKGHQHLFKIGVYFSDKAVDATKRFVIEDVPQTYFHLPDSMDKSEWNTVSTNYRANGDEEFLTIGYFPSLFYTKEEMKNYNAPIDSSLIDMAERSKGKNKSKKKKKYKEKDLQAFREMINKQTRTTAKTQSVLSFGQFTLRYYFDDFCIAKIHADGSFNCEPKKIAFSNSDSEQKFRLNRVYFQSGEALLLDSSFYELDRLSFFLKFKPDVKIKIIGHTDDIGKEKENLLLSEARAEAVKNYLIQKGLDPNRIFSEGKGESEPIADNESPGGRLINRRVEFLILD